MWRKPLPYWGLMMMTKRGREGGVQPGDSDVRLIRNVWARKGVMERVRGVKYMWGLFACNELLHRRFGMLESASCSCCPNTIESPWHVIGECNDDVAVQARSGWRDRMWEVLRKETKSQSVGVQPFALMCSPMQ
jgi:hypothetical protein